MAFVSYDDVMKNGPQAYAAPNLAPKKSTLGQGGAGEFAGNALRAVAAPLVRTGAAIESGLDQTLGRVGNAVTGKGFTPTQTGAEAFKKADQIQAGADDTFAGKAGTVAGTVAPFFTPAGGEKEVADLITHLGLDATKFGPKIASYLATKAPIVARDVGIGTAQTGDLVQGAEQGIGGAVGAEVLGKTAGAIGSGIKGAVAHQSEKAANFVTDLTSPKINKSLAESAIKQGSSRVKEGGVFGQNKLLPNAQDTRIANSVADVVSPKKRLIENVDAINKKISQTNEGVHEYIRNNKAPFNENQLRTQLDKAKSVHKNLLFAGDKAAEDAYDGVINEFMSQIGKKDTQGLFEARQSFDKYLKTKLPNIFKKDSTGQFLDPRDNIRVNAALDVRKAVNEYVADLLPEGNPYKATLLQETDMLTALSRIAEKNAGKISAKNLKLLIARHPVLSTIGISALSALGVGAAGGAVHAATQSPGE